MGGTVAFASDCCHSAFACVSPPHTVEALSSPFSHLYQHLFSSQNFLRLVSHIPYECLLWRVLPGLPTLVS